jgi:CRP-like cAMP-binding protein/CheY-like chemotaxis protein
MKTILLIEDSDIIRENTAEILELAGYHVLTAANGKSGVAQALAARPDVVVCDIMMPVLDGYGVLHIFGQHPQLAGVPFIFLTAKTERADLRRGMELGADDYITKPFEEAELLSAIASRLHRVRQLQPAPAPPTEAPDEPLSEAQAGALLEGLTADRRPHQLRKKQELYAEGDEPTRLYFVQAGRVKTLRRTSGGKELITGVYGPGEFLGYLPLLEHRPHPDTAVVVDEATVLYIPKEDFDQLLHRHPAVGQQFVRQLAGRVNEREQQLLGMAYDSLRRRVADTLLRLHEQAGGAADACIQLSREDLAAIVGTASESLIRTLTEFRQDGLIEQTAAGIQVLQPEKLRRAHW